MFKWLKKRIRNWVQDDGNMFVNEFDECRPINPSRTKSRGIDLGSQGTNVTFYKANGGYVVECSFYDVVRDNSIHTLYVVNGEEELGNAISKILTMEALRR